jgi:putative ABC transport system permease protein
MSEVRPTGDLVRQKLAKHLKQDWVVTVPLDRLEAAEQTQALFKNLLVAIASISLGVGGIGIMNIMLATVTERTREIGIRRALGAKRRDITMQFLVESMVQTSVGGLLGVALGLLVVFAVPPLAHLFQQNLPAKLDYESIALALVVAVGVGVVFGWYPAHRAARLDPIEALRHV